MISPSPLCAQFLVELHDLHGRPAAEGTDIDVPLTQEELASVIAASRDAVGAGARLAAGPRPRLTDRRRIVVRDVEGLRRDAG